MMVRTVHDAQVVHFTFRIIYIEYVSYINTGEIHTRYMSENSQVFPTFLNIEKTIRYSMDTCTKNTCKRGAELF